ncbi:MAG: hypothetical protein RIR11_4918 [Bacteroidota bacterium]|jgi:hypothetical protein
MKKLLIGFAVLLVLLLGAMVSIPYFYKDEIVAAIKKAANDELTAQLDFESVDISLFREFPKLAVGLKNLSVINGPGVFANVPLLKTKQLDVAVDLWAAIFDNNIIIKGLSIDEPEMKVYALSNGAANYDITKPAPPTTTTTESSPIKLEYYEIKNGNILYDDRGLDMVMEMKGLNHKGKGDLAADIYDFVMETRVQQLSVNYGGVQYLRNAKADWDATINADMGKMRFTMKENKAKVNDLTLNLDGWVEMPNETDILMDLTFGTPKNDFKSFLSIIPGAYTQDFNSVKADGTIAFSGSAKGKFNETVYPNFQLKLNVGNGSVQYPTLPLGISGINVDALINSPGPSLNPMTLDISKFALKIGSNPVEGYFKLKTPVTDPTIDTKIKGVLNLAELSKAFPMEGVTSLAGIINADIMMKAAMSQIDAQKYEEVNVSGALGIQNMIYSAKGSPTVNIQTLQSEFSPQKVTVSNFTGKIGKSDISANANIDNVLAYFSTNKTMKGTLSFSSNLLDANEMMGTEPATTTTVPNDVPADTEKAFDRWDFNVDGKIGQLLYEDYKINDMRMTGHFLPNKMSISDFGLKMGESDLSGNGQIDNAWNYLFDNQTVVGTINLRSTYFDLNQFMTDEPAPAGQPPVEMGVIPVPENMDMTINADFAKVKYTNMDLNGLNGAIVVKDRTANLKDCTATVLGGMVGLTGAYNTQDLSKPLFNMDMAMQDFSFKNAFLQFETVKKLAPVAQLMDGKFNTTLSMSGLLGKDMMPDLTTLSAAGFIETISAIFNNFKPMNAIGEKLNIDYLKRLELANTKNWFEIKDGFVTIKPFDVKVKDVSMIIGGKHGISSDMNYQITTKIPRKSLGTAANSGLSFLSSEASKVGVSIAQGEYINTRFDLTGSLFNPKMAVKVLGSDGQATMQDEMKATVADYTQKAKDSVTNMANRELDKAKEKANAAADKLKDTVGKVVDKKMDEAAKKAAELAKEQAGKVLGGEAGQKVGDAVGGAVGQKAGDVVGDKGKKTVEQAQDKLNKWDPFKKKKKE